MRNTGATKRKSFSLNEILRTNPFLMIIHQHLLGLKHMTHPSRHEIPEKQNIEKPFLMYVKIIIQYKR